MPSKQRNTVEKNISKDTQQMHQSQSTAFPKSVFRQRKSFIFQLLLVAREVVLLPYNFDVEELQLIEEYCHLLCFRWFC